MNRLREFVVKNFENVFVAVVLVTAVLINTVVPYKLVFLNVYFLPVLLAAYYLDLRRSLLGALACVLIAVVFLLISPRSFDVGGNAMARGLSIFTWGCFLMLTAVIVGDLNQKLRREVEQTKTLNADLLDSQAKLEQAGRELKDYAGNLEKKVAERTVSLEQSKVAIEDLKKKVEDALYMTMDPAVVKLLIEGRLRTEKRRVSVLFSDLEKFTTYSAEKRPEMVIGDLNRYLADMEAVLLAYHGHIDKYMGDGIMAEFGAPVDYEQQALLAVLAGYKMQQRMVRKGYPWRMRIGIATGDSIIGLVGNQRQAYTAIGDTVNSASRIQELCASGKVTIGHETYLAVKHFVDCRRRLVTEQGELAGSPAAGELEEVLGRLDAAPNDPELVKKAAFLFLEVKDAVNAHNHLRRALELDPHDDKVKVAYAETTLRVSELENIPVRGRSTLHLYEVIGIRNPLLDREKIPAVLYESYSPKVAKVTEYPDDLLMPVEALDGCLGHSRVVGFLAYAIADAMKLHDQEKKDVLLAGYYADIGKSIVPHHILNRAGNLTKTEFEEIVKHSRESVRLLKTMGHRSKEVFDIIAAHHECPNGTGYPEGLSGEKIPVGARIVAVADSYDSLTSWRPYRNRWEFRAAYDEMRRETAKGKFDPAVMDVLGKLLGLG